MKTDYQSIIKQAMYSAKLTRLLAEENIGVEFSDTAHTASFEPKGRVLTFPYNTAMMDPDIHELFMFHEISHALHLPHDSIEQVRDAGVDHDTFNIVIDIRDERLIKERFPGAVKSMMNGYRKLLDQGFFGRDVQTQINIQSFESRLNAYAKLGIVDGAFINLTKSEVDFYNRCMKAVTLDDCIELSRELMKIGINMIYSVKDIMHSDEFAEVVQKIRGEIATEEDVPSEKAVQEMIDELRQQRSDYVLSNAFKETCLKNASVYLYGDYTEKEHLNSRIVTAKHYYDYMVESRNFNNNATQSVRDMRSAINTSVDSMVRVFESKKAAHRRLNAKISDTGMIDINRVYRYKFDDKIFGSEMKIPNDKNHGYVILIDMSSSMTRQINSVIQQVAVIVEFFRRINVKYKIFGFGMCYVASLARVANFEPTEKANTPTGLPIWNASSPDLVEFLNSDQTLMQHNMCLYGLMNKLGVRLGSTPTAHAMLAVEQISREFFARHRIEKRHLVVMTDGGPSDTRTSSGTLVVTDKITGKTIVDPIPTNYSIINAMGKVLEYRYNIKMTTVSITGALSASVTSMFTTKTVSDKTNWSRHGYTHIVDNATKNKVFFAKPFDVDADVGAFDIGPAKQSASQLSRQLMASMKKVKKSRAFLNLLAEELS